MQPLPQHSICFIRQSYKSLMKFMKNWWLRNLPNILTPVSQSRLIPLMTGQMFVSSNFSGFITLIGQRGIKSNLSRAVLTFTFALTLNLWTTLRNPKVPSVPGSPHSLCYLMSSIRVTKEAHKFPYSKNREVFWGYPCFSGVRKSLTLKLQNFKLPNGKGKLILKLAVIIHCKDFYSSLEM